VRRRGSTLVELLVASALALLVLGLLTSAIGHGGRLLASMGARGQAEDIVQGAIEALVFDVRRAGYDPAGAGIDPLSEARVDRITLQSDLDGNGAVDASSEEVTAYACALAAGRLSRIIGRQSLPLADGITICTFSYFDATGSTIAVPAAGLDPAGRSRVRTIGLDLALTAARGLAPAGRSVTVALRSRP
jgi:Tfp pilus assembly protein PilW